MRVLVTSSRGYNNGALIVAVLDVIYALHPDMTLGHGACKEGGDAIADRWAILNGLPDEQIERYPAEWRRYGRSAGPRRNAGMVNRGWNICLAFIAPCTDLRCGKPKPHGSHGATGCADMAGAAGIPTRRWTW